MGFRVRDPVNVSGGFEGFGGCGYRLLVFRVEGFWGFSGLTAVMFMCRVLASVL